MKNILSVAVAATAVVGAAASHGHNHQHLHAKKEATKVEKRSPDVVVEYVAGATTTVYQLAGEIVDPKKAVEGLEQGDYVVIGESTPTFSPPPPPPKPTTNKDLGAQFIEKSSPPPPPPPKTSPPPPPPKPTPQVAQAASSFSGDATGVDAEFPSGKVPCTEFPSKYGAVGIPWMGMNQWSGLQYVPEFQSGISKVISHIVTGIQGNKCGGDSGNSPTFCSYACKAGYQKAQWPTEQGNTGQSIGGLFCNKDGFLELTHPTNKHLCERGAGGVFVKNELSEVVVLCRTDYPGTENMVIPTVVNPGETVELTNPDSDTYYKWQNQQTSAQFYVNKKGVTADKGCRWTCEHDPKGCGNWAPTIFGVGMSGGISYLSMFQNEPMSTDLLDYNVKLIGDVNSPCGFVDGQFIGGPKGCTTGSKKGSKAIYRLF